jgi:hypothetical protein
MTEAVKVGEVDLAPVLPFTSGRYCAYGNLSMVLPVGLFEHYQACGEDLIEASCYAIELIVRKYGGSVVNWYEVPDNLNNENAPPPDQLIDKVSKELYTAIKECIRVGVFIIPSDQDFHFKNAEGLSEVRLALQVRKQYIVLGNELWLLQPDHQRPAALEAHAFELPGLIKTSKQRS